MLSNVVALRGLIIAILLSSTTLYAQYKYTAKSVFYGGWIVPHSKNLDTIAKGAVLGGELALEWKSEPGEKQLAAVLAFSEYRYWSWLYQSGKQPIARQCDLRLSVCIYAYV